MIETGSLQSVASFVQEAVRKELEAIAQEAEALDLRLLAVHRSLPVSPREDLMLLNEQEPDFSCIVRGAIECGRADCLRPLVERLRAAAKWEDQ
jgi:hypothetical protein